MRPTVYVPGRWVWGAVKVVVWFVAFSIFSAHKGNGAAVFLVVTAVYFVLKHWTRHRPPVVEPTPEPPTISEEDALRLLRALHYIRSLEPGEEQENREPPEQIQARRLP